MTDVQIRKRKNITGTKRSLMSPLAKPWTTGLVLFLQACRSGEGEEDVMGDRGRGERGERERERERQRQREKERREQGEGRERMSVLPQLRSSVVISVHVYISYQGSEIKTVATTQQQYFLLFPNFLSLPVFPSSKLM